MELSNQYSTKKQGETLVKFGFSEHAGHAYWLSENQFCIFDHYIHKVPEALRIRFKNADLRKLRMGQSQGMWTVNGVVPAFSVPEIVCMLPKESEVACKLILFHNTKKDEYLTSVGNHAKVAKRLAEALCDVLIESICNAETTMEKCMNQLLEMK